MRKKLLCLAMGLVLAAGSSMTVFAEDYQGASGWLADFNGNAISTNFSRAEVTDEFDRVQPGDSVEMNVTIRNSDSSQTDWYMTNEVVQTLEDAMASAEGGAYEYRLIYTDSEGAQTVLYDSDTVGGETAAGGLEGLHEIDSAAGANQYFYLDRLKEGDSGRVTLWLSVDGETQGNGYQLTLAELQLNFVVEEVPEAETRTEVHHRVNTINEGEVRVVTSVQTGDTAKLMLWSALALGCGLVLLAAGIYTWKRNREKGE